MCTLIVAVRAWPGIELLVAANRDESLDRPSGPPRAWLDRPVPLFAPEDLKSSGTWLGLNALGLFAGVTNRFGSTPPDPGRRSRGWLVLDALEEKDAKSAADRIGAIPAPVHNRYHLVLADSQYAHLVWSDGSESTRTDLGPGIHVFTERSLGAGSDAREKLIRERLERFQDKAPDNEELRALLSIHTEDPFDGTCVHAPAFRYGTRSSALIRMGKRKESLQVFYSDGSPCRNVYQDLTAEARAALGGAGING